MNINEIYYNMTFIPCFIDEQSSIQNIINSSYSLKELQEYLQEIDFDVKQNQKDTKFIQGVVGNKIIGEQKITDSVIIGLHTCGNLSPVLLSLKNQCKAVITIPCCFSHLTKEWFPLTNQISKILNLITEKFETPDLPRHFFTQDGFVDFKVCQNQVIEFMGNHIQFESNYRIHVIVRQFLGQIVESMILVDRYIKFGAKIDFGLHGISGRGYIQWCD